MHLLLSNDGAKSFNDLLGMLRLGERRLVMAMLQKSADCIATHEAGRFRHEARERVGIILSL